MAQFLRHINREKHREFIEGFQDEGYANNRIQHLFYSLTLYLEELSYIEHMEKTKFKFKSLTEELLAELPLSTGSLLLEQHLKLYQVLISSFERTKTKSENAYSCSRMPPDEVFKCEVRLFEEIKNIDPLYKIVKAQNLECEALDRSSEESFLFEEDASFFKNSRCYENKNTSKMYLEDTLSKEQYPQFIEYCKEQVTIWLDFSVEKYGGQVMPMALKQLVYFFCLTSYIEVPIHRLKNLQQIEFIGRTHAYRIDWHSHQFLSLSEHANIYSVRRAFFNGFLKEHLTVENVIIHDKSFKWAFQILHNQGNISKKIVRKLSKHAKNLQSMSLQKLPFSQLENLKEALSISIYNCVCILFRATVNETKIMKDPVVSSIFDPNQFYFEVMARSQVFLKTK